MKTVLISVIVPVYNVRNYIRECIESILAQSVSSFELILVDDGSTDDSGRICDEYRNKDARVRVIHKENGGLSSARNSGLDKAIGNYICFVDSDDTVKKDYLEKLYNGIVRQNADIAICDIESSKLAEDDSIAEGDFARMIPEEARFWLYDQNSRKYVLMVVAWNKMYKKDIFSNIRYPEGKIHEDEFVIDSLIRRAEVITFIPEKLYNYRENNSGITSDGNRLSLKHLDGIDAYVERIDAARGYGDLEYGTVTLKNAFYKLARFYKDVKFSNSGEVMVIMEKYRAIYMRFLEMLRFMQKIKYGLFLILPGTFVKLFNP